MNIYDEQLEKFYQELENDPEFREYMELKRQEWMMAMEEEFKSLQDKINNGIDPFENSHLINQ